VNAEADAYVALTELAPPDVFPVRLSALEPTLYVVVDNIELNVPVTDGPDTPPSTSAALPPSNGIHVVRPWPALLTARVRACALAAAGDTFLIHALTVAGCAALVPQARSAMLAPSMGCWYST